MTPNSADDRPEGLQAAAGIGAEDHVITPAKAGMQFRCRLGTLDRRDDQPAARRRPQPCAARLAGQRAQFSLFGDFYRKDHSGFGALRVLSGARVLGRSRFHAARPRQHGVLSWVVDGELQHRTAPAAKATPQPRRSAE